jgi:GNAT superfamily N-acetyltransferase
VQPSKPEEPDRPAATATRIDVVRVTDAVSEELAAFFRTVWNETATAESVRRGRAQSAARNPVTPGIETPAIALLVDGVVTGYLGTIPVKFWNGRDEIVAHWLKGFMVLPEYRNKFVGFAVLREMLKHVGVSAIMTVAAPALRLFAAVGYVDCGTVPNYIALLRPARVAKLVDVQALALGLPRWTERGIRAAQKVGVASAVGGVVALGLAAWRLFRSAPPKFDVDLSGVLPPAASMDELWRRARNTIGAAAVRDGTFLPWRYDARLGGAYEAAVVRDQTGTLVAVAVVRRPRAEGDERLRGLNVASLSDLLYRANDASSGLAALYGAEQLARRMDADVLLCTASHPSITGQLRRCSYIRVPGNVHFLIRDPLATAGLPTTVADWWVLRGDAHSDEVF